jgi:hypothetical protein
MRDHQAGASTRGLLLALLAPFILSACVRSHTQFLTGSNLLGDQFQLNMFAEFVDGRSTTRKTAVFRWNGTRYEFTSGEAADIKFFRVEPLTKDVLLVEGTDDKDYLYFLASKLAEATYRFVPVDEKSVGKATQKRLCVKQDDYTCMVETRSALDAFVRASIGKPPPSPMVIVLSAPATDGGP